MLCNAVKTYSLVDWMMKINIIDYGYSAGFLTTVSFMV